MLTNDTAKAYVNAKLTEWGYTEFVIINATTIHDPSGDMIDITFTVENDPKHHIFTVWLDSNGALYGEW